jgi:hypothetical protein
MIRFGPWAVVVAVVLIAAGCGGSTAGSAPTGHAVKAPACPVFHAPGHGSSYAGGCSSPDGTWHVAIREHSGTKKHPLPDPPRPEREHPHVRLEGCCLWHVGWAKPHLLLFDDSKAIIVLRFYEYPKTKLVQYAISSLPTGCPTGYNGVLMQKRRGWLRPGARRGRPRSTPRPAGPCAG